MKKTIYSVLPALVIAVVMAVFSVSTFAQEGETFSTNYFANNTTAGAPPATLRFTSNSTSACVAGPLVADAVCTELSAGPQPETECAMIYVYAADQQLTECCGCPVTTNGLVHENVHTDLLSNPLTRVTPNEGVIQIVSGLYPGVCDPTSVVVAPEIESWLTHIQNKIGTAFPVTETAGDEELLSGVELGNLEADCAYARKLGSGAGVCSCNPEAVK